MSLIRFAAYDDTGAVQQHGECAEEHLEFVAAQYAGAVAVPLDFHPGTHYVDPDTRSVQRYRSEARDALLRHPGRGWRWHAKQGRWTDARSLADARAAKWEALKMRRSQVANGGFVWDGASFDSDPDSQRLLLMAAQAATVAVARDWILRDNNTRRMTAADFQAAMRACNEHVAAAYAHAAQLRARLQGAQTLAEIDAIVW